jgi:hypothetical protein
MIYGKTLSNKFEVRWDVRVYDWVLDLDKSALIANNSIHVDV